MRLIRDQFKHNSLFIVMFLISVISIISVSIIITWTIIRMSEQFFIEKFSITNAKVINQVKESAESFNYSVVIASNNLLHSGTLKTILTEKQTNAHKMSSYFTMSQLMKRNKSNLDAFNISIMVTGRNGMNYSTDRSYWPITDKELQNSDFTRKTLKEPKKLMYHYDERENSNENTGKESYIVAAKALMNRFSGNVYGTMYFAINENEFRKFYTSYTSQGNDVFVIDRSGMIVSSNRNELIGKSEKDFLSYAEDLNDKSKNYFIKRFMGKDHIFFVEYLPSFDMYLFNVIDKQTAIGGLIDKKQLAFIFIGIILVALIIIFFVSRRLTNSLSKLVKEISNASKHDFHQYVSVNGTYETRQIGNAFNSMLEELHEYVEKLVKSQKQQRNAELAALQQQINPHFLYNTLTSIKFMVLQGNRGEAEDAINAFISLLQNTIGNVDETITVRQEVENLKNYVLINQKRYGNRIKVNYFIAPDCMEHFIPKLILQPFIENAFFHGFNRKPQGYINVLVWREKEELICEVLDNGDGMEISLESNLPISKRKQERFTGIGVRNVLERIQLIYGEAYGVNVSSELGKGTRVRISFPIK
ncbi:sensor histidine kinase [Metabacillus arenae]|uniref:Sensor histidine kinase n=1 Tax=Metabacillus arenae TaxID=2771434 RepID=A0A926RW13_9BACI|nr:sensor histidine kinase [Metabacillus arenae]MBD1379471.1 sensor histidine kinase [Metabacillus arenae]